jgi:ankyrin repeat protein
VLRSIPDEQREDVIRLLQLLVYSNEPLNLEEAVDAIAVNCTTKPYFEPKYRTPIPSEIIISCASLVMIERADEIIENGYYREVLQITHFSVQQYLKSEHVDAGWKHNLVEEHAMVSNAKLCLAYCFDLRRFGGNYDGLDEVDDDDEYLEAMPFTNTAARQWTQYAMQVKTHDNELHTMIQDFLTSDELEGARFNWLRLKDTEEHLVPDRRWDGEWFRESPEKLVPLTIASACGLYHFVESLLLCGTDPNDFCPVWGSALYAASYRGYYDVVRLLLNHGAKPNMRSGQVELSVTISSPNSTQRSEIVHALLRHDADINGCDIVVGIPLVLAAARGDEDIVDTLISKGANVNAVDNEKRDAIQVAALNGHDTIVRKLLEHKADVNSSGGPNGSALMSASIWGHVEVVRTLLKNGAVVCLQFDRSGNRNALEAASWGGDPEIFRMLIERAFHVEHSNEKASLNECLRIACDRGHDEIVKLLLEHKADVNVQCRYGSPLIAASERGHTQVVQLLLDHGANVNQIWQDTSFETSVGVSPLHQACFGGHEAVTKILLDHHADINTQCGRYGTALMAACAYQSEEFVEMLLRRGANVNLVGTAYGTALIMACVRPMESKVKMLLAYGADFDQAVGYSKNFSNDSVPRAPLLHILEEAGSCLDDPFSGTSAAFQRVFRTLVDAGASVNKADDQGQTPLHYAAKGGRSKPTEVLLQAGAFVDVVDEGGRTPLIQAVWCNGQNLTKILLKAGAKINIQDADGKTALHHAAERGWLEICIILVEAGANLDVLDSQGLTPLQLAEQEDESEIVALLQSYPEEKSRLIANG